MIDRDVLFDFVNMMSSLGFSDPRAVLSVMKYLSYL